LRDAVRGCFPLGKNNRKSRDAEEGYPRRRHTQDSTRKTNTAKHTAKHKVKQYEKTHSIITQKETARRVKRQQDSRANAHSQTAGRELYHKHSEKTFYIYKACDIYKLPRQH
jgi:hypothetical protein